MNYVSSATQSFIKLDKVSKTYPGAVPVTALKKIDLVITAGERLALLGKSGSGKSTLLNLMALIDKPSRGRLLIDNRDTTAFSEKEATSYRRHDIGFWTAFEWKRRCLSGAGNEGEGDGIGKHAGSHPASVGFVEWGCDKRNHEQARRNVACIQYGR